MRPRPSDEPVMNTRATLTPPVMPSYRLTNPNALPAPRVFPLTLCAARRSVLRFMAGQAATWDPATANDLLRLELLCHVDCVA